MSAIGHLSNRPGSVRSLPRVTPESVIAEDVTELIRVGREREGQPLGHRRALTEVFVGGSFVAAAVLIAVLCDADRALALGPAFALVVLFAAGFRFVIDVGVTYTAPVQLAFVPMLFLLPTSAVPLLVMLAWFAGRLPDVVVGKRRTHPDRLLLVPANCWFSIGPVLVLLAADAQLPDWSDWPVYLLALLAQFAGDTVVSTLREWLGEGLRPSVQLRTIGFVSTIDALLSPLGILAAFASQTFEYAFLLLVPPAFLITLYVRERSRSVASAVALATALRDRESLIAGASHELVTPLGVLVGLTARVTDGPPLPTDRREQLDAVMRREVIALRHVVRQFVDYTRLKTERDLLIRPEATRLEPVVSEIVIALTGMGRVGVVPTQPLPPALVDRDRAHQMVMSMTAEALEGADAAQVELGMADDRIIVTVTSAQPMRERPFAEGGEGSSAGLGLYVTRELARRHGGDLEALPSEDGGARYVLRLPIASSGDG